MTGSLTADINAIVCDDRGVATGSGAEVTAAAATGTGEWSRLVEAIRAGDESAFNQLYSLFSRGIRLQLCRALGPHELDDRVHDTFLIVAQTIQRGELREPERLMGFVRTVVRRQIAMYIAKAVQQRKEKADFSATEHLFDQASNPEEALIFDQQVELVRGLLRSLRGRDGEILKRFYLEGASPEEICRDLGITINQFRLIKSRAKAKFSAVGRRRLARRSLRKFSEISLQSLPSRAH